MSPFADFGAMVVETDVDRALIRQLRLWLPTYLTRAEEERGLPHRLLARPIPESYQNALEDDTFPDGRLPAIVVTTAATEGDPERGDQGAYFASWRSNVSVIVRGRTPSETREVAAVFGGCVRRLLFHEQLGDDPLFEGEIRWRASNVAPVEDLSIKPDQKGRWLAAAINRFTVYADLVLSGDGPVLPDPDDPPYPSPDPAGSPDVPYDPLAFITGVTTTIIER